MTKFTVFFLSLTVASASALEVERTRFSGSKQTPCPAVIAAAPSGEVFVGVDLQGSLGKKPGFGKVVRLVDTDQDGIADIASDFAKVDNPRGICVLGDQVIVLHTVSKDGTYDNQQLSVFEDKDWDGIADGPGTPLVTNIGNSKFLQSRGADHCTNNIRYAIDGWIYISVGDFGFVDAEGTDGQKLTMHGGVARVRADGTGLENFISGTRNVYDVAIDGFMNVFARENTNDGIGWWVRASHFIQSADYGYPSLYTNFPEDMLPAMAEYGAGSGVGALYLQEPQWPDNVNDKPLLSDWGHSMIYIHHPVPAEATFTNRVRDFVKSPQITDLDTDASGRIYLAAWNGAGYQGNPTKGFVERVVPKGWVYEPFERLIGQPDVALIDWLKSDSITARTAASYHLVKRKIDTAPLLALCLDAAKSLETRAAALYTLAQIEGAESQETLGKLYELPELREHAVREMADLPATAKTADTALLSKALEDENPRVQVAAAVALGRTGDKAAATKLISIAETPAITKIDNTAKKPAYESRKISDTEDEIDISVDIKGFSQLVLIVDQLKENKFDHSAWLEPSVILENGSRVDLTTQKPISTSVDRGSFGVNVDCVGAPLTFKGKPVKGLGVHAQSEIVFALPEDAAKFTARGILTSGAKGEQRWSGEVAFAVSQYNSKPIELQGYIAPNTLHTHSVVRPEQVLPHIAQKAIIKLDGDAAIVSALKSGDPKLVHGALSTAKFDHSVEVVKALIDLARKSSPDTRWKAIKVLARLHQKEKDYDGSTWWSTRPNPDGPYFYPVDWEGTQMISDYLAGEIAKASDSDALVSVLKKNKAYVANYNPRPQIAKKKLANIGNTAIEDVVLYLSKNKGDPKNGAKMINQVGCVGCHSVDTKGPIKGPDLTALGSTSDADLAEAILKPAASIAPSWLTVTTRDGGNFLGTLVSETAEKIILHDIAGTPTEIPVANIAKREPGMQLMTMHLCDILSLKEFSDLIAYIKSMDK